MSSLSGILNIASTALQASQTGISVVSNNVSNVNTPGYVREVANQQSLVDGGAGAGVAVTSVTRAADSYLQQASLTAAGDAGNYGAISNYLDQAQTLFGDPSSSSLTAGSNSSRCNSALVVRRHGDRQKHPEQTRSSIDSNCSSWTNSNGRPTTWPDVTMKVQTENNEPPLLPPPLTASGPREMSLKISRCPRRRYSSSASMEIRHEDTRFDASIHILVVNSPAVVPN